ncbi:glycosyl hydrolase [soil metagenome]
MKYIPILLSLLIIFSACGMEGEAPVSTFTPIDVNATDETRTLFTSLDAIRHQHVLFGHQDDLAYGYNWINEPGRSDVLGTTGSYPAVYGWELGDLELGYEENLDAVNFENMKEWIKEGYRRGGVITIGWHMNNPVTGGDAWDTEGNAVPTVLPGGENHEMFKEWLDRFADFAGDLTAIGSNGETHPIPILFRPFHEMTGSWFWWGRDLCTPEEFVELWQFTVDYLKNEKGLNHLLYSYSTDVFNSKEDYLERYPGDDYVDMLGYDDYHSVRSVDTQDTFVERLEMLVEMAEERNKIPAMTETGYEGIPDPEWWTETLLAGINANENTRRIAYVLAWRNANHENDRPNHYYAPFPGHPSEANFVEFREHPLIMFEEDLPDLYSIY